MTLIPRAVAFIEGKAVATGCPTVHYPSSIIKVIELPTDHYDFLGPIDVRGKTETEIREEAKRIMK